MLKEITTNIFLDKEEKESITIARRKKEIKCFTDHYAIIYEIDSAPASYFYLALSIKREILSKSFIIEENGKIYIVYLTPLLDKKEKEKIGKTLCNKYNILSKKEFIRRVNDFIGNSLKKKKLTNINENNEERIYYHLTPSLAFEIKLKSCYCHKRFEIERSPLGFLVAEGFIEVLKTQESEVLLYEKDDTILITAINENCKAEAKINIRKNILESGAKVTDEFLIESKVEHIVGENQKEKRRFITYENYRFELE